MNNPTGDQSSDGNYQVIKITCPACQYQMDAQLRREETTIMCPDCWEDVSVPSAAAVESPKDPARCSTKRQQAVPGKTRTGKRKPTRRPAASKQKQAADTAAVCTTVTCHTCHARVEAVLTDHKRHVTCPDCFLDIPVPRLQDVPVDKRFTQSDGDEQLNHYRTVGLPDSPAADSAGESSAPVVNNPRRNNWPERTQTDSQKSPPTRDKSEHPAAFAITGLGVGLGESADLRIETPQKPPRWTFFSGVFTFPWYPEIRGRWLGLSCGCLVITWVFLAFILPVLTGGIGSLDFGSAILFVTFGAFEAMLCGFFGAYATAHLLPVLIETASGSDHITGWPELGINDWLSDLFSITVPLSAVAAATYGVAQLTQSMNGQGGLAAVAVFPLILAVVLLSSLESGSPWTILTASILRSIGKHWSIWAVFYLLSTGLVGAFVMLVVSIGNSPAWASLVAGPLAAALMFIYARLLGRLGWKAATHKPKRRQGNKKPKDNKQQKSKRAVSSQ